MLTEFNGRPAGFPFSSRARIGAAMAMLLCAAACHHRSTAPAPGAQSIPPPPAPGIAPATAPKPSAPAAPIVQGEEGIASWYGIPYHGRRAASGEIYDMYKMTAAHRTLPFGTQVRVHDLDNGRDIVVRINDRGPFVEGRIIDLSKAAAQAMGMFGPGVANVRLEILGLGETAEAPVFAVQVGAFRDPANAGRLKSLLEAGYGPVDVQSFDRGDGMFYRVRVGHESSEAAAQELAHRLRTANLASQTFVIRMN